MTKKRYPGEIVPIKQEATAECVRQMWDYCPETGHLTWRKRVARCVVIGRRAGHLGGEGYRRVVIGGKFYQEHRIIWLHVYGYMPQEIDHVNGDRSDNRLANLRACTRQQNNANMGVPRHNKSGRKGVHWDSKRGKWFASIKVNGKTRALGRYDDIDDASAAYAQAALAAFGEFARAE